MASLFSVSGNTYIAELLKVIMPSMSFLRDCTNCVMRRAAAADFRNPDLRLLVHNTEQPFRPMAHEQYR